MVECPRRAEAVRSRRLQSRADPGVKPRRAEVVEAAFVTLECRIAPSRPPLPGVLRRDPQPRQTSPRHGASPATFRYHATAWSKVFLASARSWIAICVP